jgi:acyl dehydratase
LLRLGVQGPRGPAWDETLALGGLSDRVVHERVAEFDAPIDIGRRYAPVSGDFNPIHLTGWSARLLGFDQPIAHGMWTLARALAVLGIDRVDGPHQVHTVFGSPVRLPARVSVWSGRNGDGLAFEVRDLAGERVHLRGRIISE